MKKSFIIGALVVLLIGVLFIVNRDVDPSEEEAISERPIGESLFVSTFTQSGEETGSILLQVPFISKLVTEKSISIAVDRDNDGTFSQNEFLIADFPVSSQADWRSGFYARSEEPIASGLNARITIGGNDYDVTTEIKTVEVGELLDLASVTDPENAMKGWGAQLAHAQTGLLEITQEGVPDLTQRKGECAPTSAANSLISLVAQNGGDDLIPGDPLDFIENLKRHMNWTPENGVLPDDFFM